MSVHAAAASHPHSDPAAAKMGMWLFLFTELLLFGGLFLLYAVYRTQFAEDFHFAAGMLDPLVGTINTLVLLTSSVTMALSIKALAEGHRKLSAVLLVATIAAGLAFMVNKYFEWSAKFEHHLYPNSTELLRHTPGENIFFGLYYGMTGLHGLHVVVGIGLLGFVLYLVARRPRRSFTVPLPADAGTGARHARTTVYYDENEESNHRLVTLVENSGLYWHLVDVIWIFLFPLFYLIS